MVMSGAKIAVRLLGQLVEEADGGPLPSLNVRGYVYGADDALLPLGYGTTNEDGAFSLEAAWWDASPTGGSLRFRFEVLDGRLDLIRATEQEIVLEALDAVVNITLAIPFAPQLETADQAPASGAGVARLRVVPEQATVALGARVVLLAEAQDGEGVPVGGVRIGWRAQDADGQEVPISSGGEFVGRMPGVYEVTARGGDQERSATVTVRDYDARLASAAPVVAALASEDGDVGPRWADDNAASAFAPTNRLGLGAPALSGILDRPWLGVRRDELTEAVTVGSANYTFSAPVVRLEGRGMDVQLDLTYNSRLWNRSEDQVVFDVDQGWPAPGWSLGFGRIVRLGRRGSMLVDADGTRHPYEVLRLDGDQDRRLEFAGRTTDGSFIDYEHVDDFTGGFQWAQARYPDGRTVEYTARGHDYVRPGIGTVTPSWGVLFPTRITDANGNVITIAYRNNVGPEIDTIVDTLGRAINFHYDSTYGQLTAITGPGLEGARRTLVRLNLVRMRPEPAFAGLEIVRRYRGAPLVMRAIYYPGTATGYWFGDPWTYSMYGMATRVTRHRGMGFNNAALTQAGTITPGSVTHQRTYDYPLVADPALTDVPTYTSMTETWEGMDAPPAVTRYASQPEANPRRTEVTYPNGTRTVVLAHNRPRQPDGLPAFDDGLPYQQEIYDGGRLVQLTTNIWQQGDYRSPRLARVETTRERSLMTVTEYDYGPYNRVMEVRELEFGGTAVLRRTRTAYEQGQGYVRRHIFFLPSVVEVFQGSEALPSARTEYVYDGQPLRDTPGVVGHAQTHNPYAPRVCVPPYDELECDPDPLPRTPPCRTIHHDGYWQTEYDTGTRFRGNPTEIRRYADAAQRRDPVVERRTYDITGNLVLAEAGRYERSVYEYSLATQYAYLTRHVLGPAQPVSAQIAASASYDFGTGAPRSTIDANGRSVQISYEPVTLRPSVVTWPTGATTTFTYDDPQLSVAETTRAADGTLAEQRTVVRNGLGLVQRQATLVEVIHVGDFTLDITADTERRYDALGRLWKQSRPYRSDQSPLFTEVFRDALGRVTRTRGPDGSETQAYYNERALPEVLEDSDAAARGQTTRLVDAWGRERWLWHNALGQLQFVVEPDPDGDGSVFAAGAALTSYFYNALNQVVVIIQRVPSSIDQPRWFRYDGLGRLTHQALTERSPTLTDAGVYRRLGSRWSDVFAYADETRMAWRMDARGVRTVFDYGDDPLGRLQRVTYERTSLGDPANPDPANPPAPASAVGYEYVTTGDLTRLLRVTTDDATEEYGYDDHGRLTSKTLILPDQPRLRFAVDYGHDSFDRLRSITYPAAYGIKGTPRKRVAVDYDLASRANQLTVDELAQASEIAYAPCGLITGMTVGASSPQPVTEIYDCNPANGLLTGQRVLRDSATLLDLSYDYQLPGRLGVTGQLVATTDNLDATHTTSYDYDLLGRLRQASGGPADPPLWSQRYTYDRYSNRTDVVASGTAPDGSPIPHDGITGLSFSRRRVDGLYRTDNQIIFPGVTYDEAGNLTRFPLPDGSWQRYHYDAAGRLVSVTDDTDALLESYTYSVDRRRIRAGNARAGTQTCFIWHGNTVIAEYEQGDGRPHWSRALVYLGARLLCTYAPASRRPGGTRNPAEVVRYHHPDRLGTRLSTTPETGEVTELITLPYGTPLQGDAAATGAPAFTSYDRSPVTGLDYAINRHYDPKLARFLQPDPLGAGAIRLGEPQSNNAFGYVEGDPTNRVDPLGLAECVDIPGQEGCTPEILVVGVLDPPRAGDSPDEYAREELRREGRERGERGRGGGAGAAYDLIIEGLNELGQWIESGREPPIDPNFRGSLFEGSVALIGIGAATVIGVLAITAIPGVVVVGGVFGGSFLVGFGGVMALGAMGII
jgi:RHS repeat-associated protein